MLHLRGTLMRGGTSKCWVFDADEVAGLPVDVESVLLAAFGAADPLQIDGVGGATSTTSKALLVRRSSRADADVDYTFAQVGIGSRSVEWGSNCGNCATAAGLYAVQAGLVDVRDERTTVRLHNTNTGTRVTTTIDTPHGRIPETGPATVPGVEAAGVPVALTFVDPAGRTTGALLPTGHAVDLLEGPERAARATLVDAGAPAALVDAAAFGLTGSEPLSTISGAVPGLATLRREAAVAMGLVAPHDPISYAVPKVGVVGPAHAYRSTSGRLIEAGDYDVSARMVSMHAPHPAIGLTSAVALAMAATVPGSLVAELAPANSPMLRIGTAAGVVETRAEVGDSGFPAAVTLFRAARRIAVADVFVPLPDAPPRREQRTSLLSTTA